MTDRNINKELLHHVYYDMGNGNDLDFIDNDRLIGLLTEIVSRLESIEQRLDSLEGIFSWEDMGGRSGLVGNQQ